MPGDRYTPETRAACLDLYTREGADAASAAFGVPARTIRTWAANAGVTTEVETKAVEAREAKRLSIEQRKLDLADMFLDAAVDELTRRTASFTESKIVTIAGTATSPGSWDVATAEREPYAVERKAMVTTAAIAADKALLLTGGATSRIDVRQADREVQEKAADIMRVIQGGKADVA